MVLVWLILILIIIFVIIAVAFSVKKLKQILNSPAQEESQNLKFFAEFSYTQAEWEYVNQKEFVEDERGKGFFDKYSGIISYDKIFRKNAQRKIFFTPQEIYITDGEKGKSFTVNRLNSFGNGFRLSSVDLLFLSPLKKLRVKISVVGVSPESGELDFEAEYLVPIPQAAFEQINEILKTYADIILNA